MARPKSTSELTLINKVYPQETCNGLDKLTSMFLIPDEYTPGEAEMIEGICYAWGIAAFWIAYDMMPIVDTARPPYIFANFRQYRSWAKVLYAHQRLCAGCHENGRPSKFGTTPFWRWISCMEEVKLGHFLFTLSPPKSHSHPEGTCFPTLVSPPAYGSKPDFVYRKVLFYVDISEGRIPSEVLSKPNTNTAKLYKDAQFLAFEWRNPKRRLFKTQYWDPLVSSYQEFLDDIKKWPAKEMPSLTEGQRYIQDRKRKKRLASDLEDIAPSEVVTITYNRWSLSSVYVPACIFSNI